MPINLFTAISNIGNTPLYNAKNYDPKDFVKNASAVQGNLKHPESRTNYGEDDYRGLHAYYLA